MAAASRSRRRRPWWDGWRPGRRAEALVIALLIHGLMALSLAAGYRFYVAGLAALSNTGRAVNWLLAPSEAGVVLLLSLATGGWLAGVWLGERLRQDWPWTGLVAAALTLPVTSRLLSALGVATEPARFAVLGQAADTLWLLALGVVVVAMLLGGLAGAWWSSLVPVDESDEA
jgi:hypothetical protein